MGIPTTLTLFGAVSMIIYLVLKTHNKTGLKYLCQTIQNPFKYKGSGKYWQRHLKEHGNAHTTTIIKECSSKQELKKWGIHYSLLWNIVEERDENGNKTWANLKPEEGDGGASGVYSPCKKQEVKDKISVSVKNLGEKHPSRNRTIEQTKNLSDRMLNDNPAKRLDVRKKLSGDNNAMRRSEQKERVSGNKNPAFDPTVYTFKHKKTGQVVSMTSYDFCQTILSKNDRGNVCNLVKGKNKSVKGWILA